VFAQLSYGLIIPITFLSGGASFLPKSRIPSQPIPLHFPFPLANGLTKSNHLDLAINLRPFHRLSHLAMITNFSFVIPGVLAGGAFPKGDATQIKEELDRLGIKTVVNLTENAHPNAGPLEELGVRSLHVPVADFSAPTNEQLDDVAHFVEKKENQPVLVHCRAGIGRTGTVLAASVAYLVQTGQLSADVAQEATDPIAFVRRKRPGSLEVPEQEKAVQQYLTHLQPKSEQ
jgi:atypical dual specificity phosphatase